MLNKTQDKVSDIENSLKELTILYQNDIEVLKEEIDTLEKKKKELLEVKNIIDVSQIVDPITLNVGGVKYQTSKSTLTKVPGSYFDVMFSGKVNTQPMTGKTNTFFIDRDGTHFRYVLNYLRDGNNIPIPESIKDEFNRELMFYKIIEKAPYDLINNDQLRLMEEWIGIGPITFDLIYKGTRDGFEAKTFHEKCDNKGATINIIKTTDGSIFGGYNSQSWNSDGKYYGDYKCFLFTIKNSHGIPPTKHFCHIKNNFFAYGSGNYGITFGSGHDIYISDQSN